MPTHTASTTGAVVAPSEDNLVTSFGIPVLPSASTVAASLPLKALSTSSAPGSSTKPLSFFLATATTRASTLRVSGLLVVRVTVAKISAVLFGWIGLGWVGSGQGRKRVGTRHGRDASVTPDERPDGPETFPLHDRHVALGAKMADFGGWEMPIEYPGGGVVKEHTAVREAVGLFDVSHLGKAVVRGPGAAAYVNATLTNDLDRVGPGKAQYTLCCDERRAGWSTT